MEEGAEWVTAPSNTQRLTEELQVERQMKEMLQISTFELRSTVAELEKRLNSIEDEGNEWKTRYETQVELNKQLERQIRIVQEKSEQIRGDPTDRLASIRSFDHMPIGALNQFFKHLEEEKISLENQLKEFEHRIQQETKAYYKVNDERRIYVTEIAQTTAAQEAGKKQQIDPANATREKQVLNGLYTAANQKKGTKKKEPVKKSTKDNHLPKIKH
ncbi:coiled-coil domain-containing protein 169 isoform X1 [Bombina bombina]|uniref:coiled-coil domain-containing protein 169 isoform X1 n=1 Tax=Bombina bombina TaxID=8345 RepID=UPI00235A6DEB|nr:coiled-coil domain-containing protein 169 isoform X1 [Bombina bombina]